MTTTKAAVSAAPQVGKFQVLAIEDDPNIARLLRETMTRAGFPCRTEGGGKAGLQAFEQSPPHLVLLDLNLPDATGFEICAHLRQTSAVPIIMLSARREASDQLQGFKLGADDYVTKPFDPKLLLARVVAQLRRAYHYETPTPTDTSAENRWLTCDACNYMGPRDKFQDLNAQGLVTLTCPHCGQRANHLG